MTTDLKIDNIQAFLEDLRTEELVDIHNEYCSANNYMDDYVYRMSDFDMVFEGESQWECVRKAYFGERFNPTDEYFYFNGYANLESFDYHSEHSNSNIYTYELAK